MNKRNFVYNYVPLKADFDELQNDLEAGINNVAKAVAGKGILNGLNVSIASSTATVSTGAAFDGLGNRIELKTALDVDIGSIARPAAGQYKWVTLALRYIVRNEGTVMDGNNRSWPARLLDHYSAILLEGTEAASPTKPTPQDEHVPLIDIKVDRSSDWENLVTETNRRTGLVANTVIFPVGYTYAQYPGGLTPAAMGWPGTWTEQFAGESIFFRSRGNLAEAFNYADIQGDAMQRMKGVLASVWHGTHADPPSGVLNYGRRYSSNNGDAGTAYARSNINFDNAGGNPGLPNQQYKTDGDGTGTGETRPRNRTFRIWKRTA